MVCDARVQRSGRNHVAMAAKERAAAARILAFGRERYRAQALYANIASSLGVAQYVTIAAEVGRWVDHGKILDWGAGWGQNSLLLHAHGARVTAYDVEDKGAAQGLLAGTGIPYRLGAGRDLPLPDEEFDAVLNCGVLEHVPDERHALAELRRVLRPRGYLFTYHLPNRHAWTERLGRWLGPAPSRAHLHARRGQRSVRSRGLRDRQRPAVPHPSAKPVGTAPAVVQLGRARGSGPVAVGPRARQRARARPRLHGVGPDRSAALSRHVRVRRPRPAPRNPARPPGSQTTTAMRAAPSASM